MRVVIAGSRHGRPAHELTDAIVCSGFAVTEIVHGAAPGVDQQADDLARAADIPVTKFAANWLLFGKAAGPIRNRAMAKYAALEGDGGLIALAGGDGTASMVREARRAGLKVYIHPPSKGSTWTS